MMPQRQAGMVTATICGMEMVKPFRPEIVENATTAAEMGEQTMASMDATEATASGRSGRMPFLMATSVTTGISVYITCPVPQTTVRKKVLIGARRVMCCGCLRRMRSTI